MENNFFSVNFVVEGLRLVSILESSKGNILLSKQLL